MSYITRYSAITTPPTFTANDEEPARNGRLNEMGHEIPLDDVTKLEPGQIMADSVRQWRPDCKAGQFKIGASTIRGNKIEMELIGAQICEGEYFNYPRQKWLAILFVDPDGVLSSILFKTESLDNFEELRRQYRLKGESLLGKTIRAEMGQRSSTKKDPTTGEKKAMKYHAVQFEVMSQGKYAEAITQFRQIHYSLDFIRLIDESNQEAKAD